MDDVKMAAAEFMSARKLKPNTAKGYEALLAFYIGWYRGIGNLPPFVTIAFTCGRQSELLGKPH